MLFTSTFKIKIMPKIELEKVRQSIKGKVECEAKGKQGREHDNNMFNPLDFDSVGLEQNKTAPPLKPFFVHFK
jgi:hypothetical protein